MTKKYLHCLFITSFLILFSGCLGKTSATATTDNSGGGTVITTTTTKALASSWAVGAFTVDLTNVVTTGSTFSLIIKLSNGEQCTCAAAFTGTDTSGSCVISSCSWTGGGSDPQCASNAYYGFCPTGNGTYTHGTSTLQFSGNSLTWE